MDGLKIHLSFVLFCQNLISLESNSIPIDLINSGSSNLRNGLSHFFFLGSEGTVGMFLDLKDLISSIFF